MEPIVYEDSPLADYLRGRSGRCHRRRSRRSQEVDGGDGSDNEWANASEPPAPSSSNPSPPASPTPFAPTGRPSVRARFHNNKPSNLPQLNIAPSTSLQSIKRNCSVRPGYREWLVLAGMHANVSGPQAMVAASIDRADNARFLEKFRYTIVASQLLSGHSILGPHQPPPDAAEGSAGSEGSGPTYSAEGILASVLGALAVAVILSWVLGSAPTYVTRKRFVFLLVLIAVGVVLGQVYMRRQWLRYRREQSLSEVASLVSVSQEFDSASGAALALIQEVELVSRGYRM